jgi:hypothetical protein
MRYLVVAAIVVAGCGSGGGADMPNVDLRISPDQSVSPMQDAGGTDVDGGADLSGPSCADGVQNGDETDVDCGGGTCPKCPLNQMCLKASDCISGSCTANRCTSTGWTLKFAAQLPYSSGGSQPYTVVVADMNGDKKPDLVVGNNGAMSGASVLLGDGKGGFKNGTLFPAGMNSQGVDVGDCDGDGKPDAVVANVGGGMSFLRGNGDGTLSAPATQGAGMYPDAVSLADLNQDGKLDAVVSDASAGINVLVGNGDGTFHSAVPYAADLNSQNNVIADLNGDGKLDVVVVNAQPDDISVLFGKGDGSFGKPTNYPTGGTLPLSVAVGDFNNDGKPDVVAANITDHVLSVWLNSGNGALQPPVFYTLPNGQGPRAVTVGDFDRDGNLDLAVPEAMNGGPTNICIYLGKGDGTFPAPALFPIGQDANTAAVGDFNSDGKPDLAIADSAGVIVLINMSK